MAAMTSFREKPLACRVCDVIGSLYSLQYLIHSTFVLVISCVQFLSAKKQSQVRNSAKVSNKYIPITTTFVYIANDVIL